MRKYLITCLLLLSCGWMALGQETHFPKSDHLVNDYSGILTPEQRETLETRLVAFNDSTSNQIAVIITPTLYGEEIMDLGTRIGHEWGIGQEKLDNGVLILIKSKTAEEPDGDVAILPGYGLEGALPDAFCMHIIDDKMIPSLAEGDYYTALVEALDVIESVCVGEYSYEQYKKEDRIGNIIASIIVIVFFWALFKSIFKKGTRGGGGSYTHGGWSSGWSSGGHSSGGFSGFGGGGFGGGGAHGKF